MDVTTADSAGFSLRTTAVYAGITGALVLVALLPALVSPRYLRVLNTMLLLALLGLVVRTMLAAALSFGTSTPPTPDRPDEALPDVSIVVPAYDEEPVLPDTIEACRAVDYPAEKLEVVLCYEADSTDRTGEICRAAAANDPRITAVERDEPGGGKAKATNYALQFATGDVLASIDADHCFEPDAVRRAVRWFESDDDVWCVKGRCFGRNPEDSALALHATVERHIAERAELFARQVAGGFTIFGGGQAFFRREAFEELGVFDEDVLVEDIDMSSRIHAAGKDLRVDPEIITFEENPVTLRSWWSQRKRWARGWMQVATRYLPRLPRNDAISFRRKLDSVYTFVYALVPAFLVLAFPMAALSMAPDVATSTYLPHEGLLWNLAMVTPVVAASLVFVQDWRAGLPHSPWELLAACTLWLYLALQTAVFVTAFIEEFVLGKSSVYVTTARAGSD